MKLDLQFDLTTVAKWAAQIVFAIVVPGGLIGLAMFWLLNRRA
jgi:hypothetical protein